jgi:hypothetical protein
MDATVYVSYKRNNKFLNCRKPCSPRFSVTRGNLGPLHHEVSKFCCCYRWTFPPFKMLVHAPLRWRSAEWHYYFMNNFFILLRLCLFKKLGNERISDILMKLKKVAAENTELLPEVYGEDGRVIK